MTPEMRIRWLGTRSIMAGHNSAMVDRWCQEARTHSDQVGYLDKWEAALDFSSEANLRRASDDNPS